MRPQSVKAGLARLCEENLLRSALQQTQLSVDAGRGDSFSIVNVRPMTTRSAS